MIRATSRTYAGRVFRPGVSAGLKTRPTYGAPIVLGLFLFTGCAAPSRAILAPRQSHAARVAAASEAARLELARLDLEAHRWPEDRAFFRGAAVTAWAFIERNTQPKTGLVSPVGDYSIATVWDVGSTIAAIYSAHELGVIDQPEYTARMAKLLDTLEHLRLFDGRILNRSYETRTGEMLDNDGKVSARGAGWSTTDLGRLLMWLRILRQDPAYSAAAERIVRRNDFSRVVRGGYLWGAFRERNGHVREYQEGRVGYEQYAATGFARWGFPVAKALDLSENALPITVMGEPLLADARRADRLTNEPFLLLGLEAGWDRRTAALVRSLLRAQEARHRQTGIVTLLSEDAVRQPPFYFYYYCLFTNGKTFGVDTQDRSSVVDGPRWVSSKSAFALHALLPSPYTDLALRAVLPARSPGGWASGVYEASRASTNTVDINTAAVVLTAALYERRNRPFLERPASPPAG